MKRYEAYKDTNIEWIGQVPNHWKIVRLRYLSSITTGDKDTINKEDDGLYPFYVRSKKIEKISTFKYDEEAILTPGDGDICKIWHYIDGKFECHQRVYKLSDFKEVNGKFLYYYLLTNFENDVIRLSAKSTVDSLRMPMFQNFVVVFGSFEEQQAIANYLDRKTLEIDSLVEKKKQLITLLQEERTAIINHAVTKGIDPNVKFKYTGIEWIGEIPEHWEVKRLKYACSLINNKTSEKPEYILALENISSWSGVITGNPYKNNMEGDVNLFKREDILFSKLRPYLAKVTKTERDGGCIGELLVLRAKKGIISDFLFYRMISEAIINIVDGSTYGTKMPRASWEKFISLIYIPIPPLHEQEKICNFIRSKVSEINNVISKTERELELLEEYKIALISEVVTGKVDVREEIVN
ncbi:restriction endonuclease subunit S [Flavobacterium sp. C4GT6]|uniref:restriction endonuclease subunit S n=1 Tax=Flavobacterium sp. C4GT6 TaxID=3103818 RepID=UPI002ED20BBD